MYRHLGKEITRKIDRAKTYRLLLIGTIGGPAGGMSAYIGNIFLDDARVLAGVVTGSAILGYLIGFYLGEKFIIRRTVSKLQKQFPDSALDISSYADSKY